MAGFGKLALAALAASLLPYEVKKDDDGEFTYKSLLLGVKTKTDDEGKKAVELSFFNLPDFRKNTAPKAEEVPAEEPSVEEPVAAEEALAEENPAPAEEPVNE